MACPVPLGDSGAMHAADQPLQPPALTPHHRHPLPYLKSVTPAKAAAAAKHQALWSRASAPALAEAVPGGSHSTALGRHPAGWHRGVRTSIPGAAGSRQAAAAAQRMENHQHRPGPWVASFSSVGDEVMVTDTNTDGQSSARDTKCVFIIHDFCCDQAASAEVRSPDVEILQPVAFPKEKGKNQDCPWVKNGGCRATQPTRARRTEDRGCQVC